MHFISVMFLYAKYACSLLDKVKKKARKQKYFKIPYIILQTL